MKHVFAIALALLTVLDAQGCEYDLTGTWKSDGAMSMAFARENSKLQPKTGAFLHALLGHMTLTFRRGAVHVEMPDIEVPVAGKPKPFAGFSENSPYEVLLCNKSVIVWKSRRPFDGEVAATTFNFVDRGTVWVYPGGTDPKVPDLHIREYFRRVR